MRALLLAAAVLTSSAAAVADEGELLFSAGIGVDAMWLRHPLAPTSLLPDLHAVAAPIPRLTIYMECGLTNDLAATAGMSVVGTANLVTPGVAVGGVSANLITGTYGSLALPVGFRWRMESGFPLSVDGGVELSPMLAGFLETGAVDATAKDSPGRPARLPLDIADAFVVGGELRASAGADARLGGVVFALRPSFGVAWLHGAVWSIGVVVTVAIASDVGPM